jgi:hypothetical protein
MKSLRISRDTTIEELGGMVCEILAAEGIDAILTGGAVVSIYTDNEYESYDLDFILPGLGKSVESAMKKLGFSKERGRHFIHPDTPFFVEFPGNTLAIGDSLDVEVIQRTSAAGVLKLLSPTDCAKDRLAAFYHWNDRQGLDQAVAVALRHPIALERVRRWSQEEGHLPKFTVFLDQLNEKRARK